MVLACPLSFWRNAGGIISRRAFYLMGELYHGWIIEIEGAFDPADILEIERSLQNEWPGIRLRLIAPKPGCSTMVVRLVANDDRVGRAQSVEGWEPLQRAAFEAHRSKRKGSELLKGYRFGTG
jgi:hypothetical protein